MDQINQQDMGEFFDFGNAAIPDQYPQNDNFDLLLSDPMTFSQPVEER